MKKKCALWCLSILFVNSAFAADDLQVRLSKMIEPQIKASRNVGVVVGTYSNGVSKIYSFGEVKKGTAKKPTQDTYFEIGSITKTFTGLILAVEVLKGKVKLNDPISKFIPEIKNEKTAGITLQQLATHTSGLAFRPCNLHFTDPKNPYNDYTEKDLLESLTDVVALAPNCEYVQKPNGIIRYSNWGSGLLGYILSRVEAKSYEKLVKDTILIPLKMNDTFITIDGDKLKRFAQGYDENLKETPLWDRKIMFGNGALRSTAADFSKYFQAMINPSLGGSLKSAIEFAQVKRAEDKSATIGLGWFMSKLPGAPQYHSYWHTGSTGGFTSLVEFDTNNKNGVFWFANSANDLRCVDEALAGLACDPLKKTPKSYTTEFPE